MFSYQETVHQVITDQPPETEESAERLRQIAADIYQQIAPLLARRENFALNLIFDKFRFTDRYTKEDLLLVYLGIIVSYFNFLAISGMEKFGLTPQYSVPFDEVFSTTYGSHRVMFRLYQTGRRPRLEIEVGPLQLDITPDGKTKLSRLDWKLSDEERATTQVPPVTAELLQTFAQLRILLESET